jgi:hypothetical protein
LSAPAAFSVTVNIMPSLPSMLKLNTPFSTHT